MLQQLTATLWLDVSKISYINSERMIYGGTTQSKASIVVDGQVMQINELELAKVMQCLETPSETTFSLPIGATSAPNWESQNE